MTLSDRRAPGVRITSLRDERASEGTPIDLRDRIVSFRFEDCERRADKLTLQLDNFDLSLFERPELAGGAVIEVSWGYPGHMSRPRRVVVRGMKGFQTLTIEAHGLSTLMNQRGRTRRWTAMTRSAVARAIAAEHGFEGSFVDVQETSEVPDTVAQVGQTDARLLRALAAREGFEFYIDAGGFHFHERRLSAAPSSVLTWYADPGRGDLISVDVESDLVRRAGRVAVRGRDPVSRQTVEGTANGESAERVTLADVMAVIDPETGAETRRQEHVATESVRAAAPASEGALQREARARFVRAERATIKLNLKAVGDPTLHAKSIVEMRGISSLLSGLYYVSDAIHTIDGSGYICELKALRDGTGRRARALGAEQRGVRPPAPSSDEPEQGGDRNRSEAQSGSELQRVQHVDPETGAEVTEFVPARELGAGDPEGGS